ncbi:P-loop containing nucleoside triphosphate hydrolase protein [Podospora australis]|uniref:P-loop containing nucleoside triphosphate hydrolase protein n=1 Tax=Podospora australis TaxID=1536484 RepID=A0AAN6WYD1_9PEZI|nr:P-loop containing nucleoside triphosphate hydrolase protein [Podospora australis]
MTTLDSLLDDNEALGPHPSCPTNRPLAPFPAVRPSVPRPVRPAAAVPLPVAAAAADEPLPASASALPPGFFGQIYLDRATKQVALKPSDRLVAWLAGVEVPDRELDSTGLDNPDAAPSKRARIVGAFKRTFSRPNRVGEPVRRLSIAAPDSGVDRPLSPLDPPSRLGVAGSTAASSRLGRPRRFGRRFSVAASSGIAPPPSRIGTVISNVSRALAPPPPARGMKVAVLGDTGCGKTVFIERLINNRYGADTIPQTIATDFRTINTFAYDKSIVNAELWDFPGTVAGHHNLHLHATFFNAAILCYNIADKRSLTSVVHVWKQTLDHYLFDGPIFVVGLQLDRSACLPPAGMSYTHTTQPASTGEGLQIIVDYLAQKTITTQHSMTKYKNKEKAKEVVHDAAQTPKKVVKKAASFAGLFQRARRD